MRPSVLARTLVRSTLGLSGPRNQQRKYQCQVTPAPRDDACERTERTPNTPPPSQISSHPPQYTFLSLNARSLFNKIEELSEVTGKLNPLFICVQETWCVHGEPDSFYHIDGFSLFRRDRVDRSGGGVCVYVNTSQARTIERIELDNDIEAIWLKITVENIQNR